MRRVIYFDNAATTAPREEAIAAAERAMRSEWGNPSSGHFIGKAAEEMLSGARRSVASALGVRAEHVHFTSGGTESDNLAVLGAAELSRRRGGHVITSGAEHSAVLNAFERLKKLGFDVTILPPSGNGVVAAQDLRDALRADTILVSLMLVNNETGAVSPAAEYARAIRGAAAKAVFHVDAVQGFGKLPFTAETIGADLISISAHKLYSPKGAGALYVRPGAGVAPILFGGQQEMGLRPGTENVSAIAAFGVAAQLAMRELAENLNHAERLRTIVMQGITRIPRAKVIASCGQTSPYIMSIALPGYRSEVLMNCLEDAGICLSRSSACRRGARSRVLTAMRLPTDEIDGALRVSFGRENTETEAEYFVRTLVETAERLVHR
ncbi:MAG: cysteine desulfurase [Oscillospiraceae bacterium]|jgi:cysteine desulfurase|nr:cysteine desulfurase [Oscillospiraceae bacterium]